MAFERNVADDFGTFFPRNVNGSPAMLNTWRGIGTGAGIGATAGGVMAGPFGAALGGAVGAVGGALTASPMAYGAAIRATGAVSRGAGAVAPTVYRVGTSAGASSLANAYLNQPAR